MILNENYEIEGMTKSLGKRLQLYQNDYDKIIGLNILIFMGELIYFIKFEEEKTHLDEEIGTNGEEKNHRPNRYMNSFSENGRSGSSSRKNCTGKK